MSGRIVNITRKQCALPIEGTRVLRPSNENKFYCTQHYSIKFFHCSVIFAVLWDVTLETLI